MTTAKFEKYIQLCGSIEQEWYGRKPEDDILKNKIIKRLKSDNDINVIDLTGHSLKYFIRSYRAAFAAVINERFKKINIEKSLSEINKKLEKEHKSIISRTKYINMKLSKILKHNLYIKVDGVYLDITAMPSTIHLGNGHVRNIGKYSDILLELNLITDCSTKNNKALAELFLQFAAKPAKFTKADLVKINPKFKNAGFSDLVEDYCEYLTRIAMHYVLYESARRITLSISVEDETISIAASKDMPVASNIIGVLKALRDGVLTKLADAFSPESEYILLTHEGARQLGKTQKKNIVENIAGAGIFRINKIYRDSQQNLSPHKISRAILSADSNQDYTDTETYQGSKTNMKDLVNMSKYMHS